MAVALLVQSCALTTGSTSFSAMSSAYREVLESYSLDNILINVVRSSEQLPLSFLDMPNVIGTGGIAASAGLSAQINSANPVTTQGFFSAGAGSFYTPTASMSVNSNFNFTQSSLDNSTFMKQFLTDINPNTIYNLSNNNSGPKSILFSLIIDSIELRDAKNNRVALWVNDPADVKYKEFQQIMYQLIYSGMQAELMLQAESLTGKLSQKELKNNLNALAKLYAVPGTSLIPTPNAAKPTEMDYQVVRVMPNARLCLQNKKSDYINEQKFSAEAFCRRGPPMPELQGMRPHDLSHPGPPQPGKHSLMIRLRSPRNVFAFLGTIVSLQLMDNPKIIKIKDSDQFANNPELLNNPDDESTSIPLFLIKKNESVSNPIATIKYRGDTYSIPSRKGESTSREVLTLVSILLTLSKDPASIPPSPAVLIN